MSLHLSGQVVDGFGVAPAPWSIPVPIPSLFQDCKKSVRVPHTSTVKVKLFFSFPFIKFSEKVILINLVVGFKTQGCHSCLNLGRSACSRCVNSGRVSTVYRSDVI